MSDTFAASEHGNIYTIYSLKNIPHPNYDAFQQSLVKKIVDFIKKDTMEDHIYHPLRSGRIWHKVNC